MIQWKDDYCTGIAPIDEQHKELFSIANRIYDLLKNDLIPDKYDSIVAIIGELQSYTRYHFKTEEDYMQRINYRRFLSQKAAHNEFLAKMDAIDLGKIDNSQNQYLIEILDFVLDWLASHIVKADKLIA
ncbi:MAG: bacteriohemerythrin [Selenomonadaceae bacterium]|jgi:hemerythrin-like metal-binding domain